MQGEREREIVSVVKEMNPCNSDICFVAVVHVSSRRSPGYVLLDALEMSWDSETPLSLLPGRLVPRRADVVCILITSGVLVLCLALLLFCGAVLLILIIRKLSLF